MSDGPAMRLRDGTVVGLPLPINLHEFTLPGNAAEHVGFVALYDPDSATGALYYPARQCWQMVQPVTRSEFARHCSMLELLQQGDPMHALLLASGPGHDAKH